ncbi:Bax inhibitor-1/YccA family protein [Aciduricibacillus chroicocephali]|uniref:Bax inhibitor-1/YccA family protein n=1 Tax=Aciduricibacillus chroicocephali TaxID=3054939 RepID=UPI0032678C72
MRSGNPTLSSETFSDFGQKPSSRIMTVGGAVNKSFIMLILLSVAAFFTWNAYNEGTEVIGFVGIAAVIGFVVALVTTFVKKVSPVTAPIYAILEGVVIGGISAYYESAYQGITQQAVLLTLGIFAGMLFIYKSRIIRVTNKFRNGVIAATLGIAIVYLLSFVLSFFGIQIPYLHEASPLGIAISIGIVIVASLNLMLDFDYIECGAQGGAPKYMEWYSAFALMVTLVWLYLEIIRLLAKIYRRN